MPSNLRFLCPLTKKGQFPVTHSPRQRNRELKTSRALAKISFREKEASVLILEGSWVVRSRLHGLCLDLSGSRGSPVHVHQQERRQTSLSQLFLPEPSGCMLGQEGKKEERHPATGQSFQVDYRVKYERRKDQTDLHSHRVELWRWSLPPWLSHKNTTEDGERAAPRP